MKQLPLPFAAVRDVGQIAGYLQKRTGKVIALVLTDNATSMISFRRREEDVALRLHRMFLRADESVLDDIAGFIRNRRRPMPRTRAFISRNRHHLKPAPPRKVTIRARGRHYDLDEIFEGLNRRYFGGAVTAAVTWGRKSTRRFPARRTLGTYLEDRNIIRINPFLDSRRVPRFYVEYIVYHEMLHAVMESRVKNGRRRIHACEFRKREKLFEHYELAWQWERDNR